MTIVITMVIRKFFLVRHLDQRGLVDKNCHSGVTKNVTDKIGNR